MLSFLRKKQLAQKPERPIAGYIPGMTLEYFRSREDLVTFARDLLKKPQFREMLAVIHHELPISSTIEAVRAHKAVLRMIELMGTAPKQHVDDVPTTFGAHKEFPELNQPTTTEEEE